MSRPPKTDPEAKSLLDLRYENCSFLIDRHFCWTSLYYVQPEGPLPGFFNPNPPLRFQNSIVPMFHLDQWLERHFSLEQAEDYPCVLLTPAANLSPGAQEAWNQFWTSRASASVPAFVGWKVSREAQVVAVNQAEQKPFLRELQPALASNGLVGCHFLPDCPISYVLDPEALLLQALKRMA